MEQEPNKEKGRETIEKLKSYLEQGYVLHGGKNRADTLEPRQAEDDDPERKAGKAVAIYAEAHDLRIPIFMALFDQKDPSRGWQSSYSAQGDGPMQISGENYTFTPGYIYVLPRDTFEVEGDEIDSELISRQPVTPIDVIEIDPSILKDLEGITIDLKE